MKKWMTGMIIGIAAFMFPGLFLMECQAAEAKLPIEIVTEQEDEAGITKMNAVTVIVKDCDAYTEADENSAVSRGLQAGESIFITGVTDDGWYRIYGNEGPLYIKMDMAEEPTENESLIEELNQWEEQGEQEIENFQQQRKAALQAKIWGAVILLLIIGIFAVGITSTLKENKKKK